MNGVYDDEKILADLRRIAAEVDPVPELVLASARAVLSLRRLDAELIELVRDSAEDRRELVAVRGEDDDVRMLSFELGPITVELQVTGQGHERDLIGHVSGVELAGVTLETTTSHRELDVDAGGLVAGPVARGLTRLHLTTTEHASYTTNWVRI